MTLLSVYDVGDQIDLIAEFKVETVLTDPATVVCRVRQPDGTVTAHTVIRNSVGEYQTTINIDQEGTWAYRFEGTDPAMAAQEKEFSVRRQLVL